MSPSRKKLIYEFILEKISEAGDLALDGLFPKNGAEGRMWRRVLGLPEGYEFSRPNFSAVLSRLRRQGLIAKKRDRRWTSWVLTPKGKEKISIDLDFNKSIEPDGIPRLVLYDVPETERRKRDLMRDQLTSCGYKQLQKSVWLGYNPLPEEFLKSLEDLKLQRRVHLVSINKAGTIDIF